SGSGSLTFTTSSARAYTAAASSTSCAPAASYASSARPAPSPAPRCTSTWWPRADSSRVPAGVRPTRYSWFLVSVGTPTSMGVLRGWTPQPASERRQHLAQHREDVVDVPSFDDQRRGQGDGVAGHPHQQPLAVRRLQHLVAARARRAVLRGQLDRPDQAEVADVD